VVFDERLHNLPGAELVAAGIEDLKVGTLSIHALLVLIGAVRMQRAGLDIPQCPNAPDCPEHALTSHSASKATAILRTRVTTLTSDDS